MVKFFKHQIKNNFEISILILVIIITANSTRYFNFKKNSEVAAYNTFIDNIYLRKTLKHLVDNLEPKYKKVKHKTKKYPLTVVYSLYVVNRIIELVVE